MKRKRSPQDLSVEELRQLLIEKKRLEREARLEHFKKTGRTVNVEGGKLKSQFFASQTASPILTDIDKTRSSPVRSVLDRMLLILEVAAVIGFIYILFSGLNVLKDLNKEVSSVLEQPTLTPTPLIYAVVLPSGHTPPGSPGGVQPNDAEIPAHLAPLVQSLKNVPIPTPGPEQAIRIQIPAINVDAPVVHGDGWEQLKKGVGQNVNTPNPGQNGNIVLSAHNDIFGEIFRDLDQLQPGDEIILFTSQRTQTYTVQQTQIVEPTHVEVMDQTQDPIVTLISCYPYLVDDKRIVVQSILQK